MASVSSDRSDPRVGAPLISRGGRQGIGHQSDFPGGLLTTAQPVGYLNPHTYRQTLPQETPMDEASITQYITDTFDGVDVVVASRDNGSPEVAWGDTFFSYDPGRQLPPAHRFPFATIVTKDYGDFDCAPSSI